MAGAPPQTSFIGRRIDCIFTLGQGTFSAGKDTVRLQGHRIIASITKAGGASLGGAQLRIYGMKEDQMNQLSTLGLIPSQLRRNSVSVMAGDNQSGMSLVFQGTIIEAWADYSGAPEVCFNVTAFVGGIDAVKPVAASSYNGPTNAATIMEQIAQQMGATFENNGVNKMLANPYFPGTARQQAEACARAGAFEWVLDNGVLAIWPQYGSRSGQIPLFSPATGLVGYPTYQKGGVIVKAIFNPVVQYGSKIKVQSSLKPASGTWTVFGLNYDLAAEIPDGPWFMIMKGFPPGYAPVF